MLFHHPLPVARCTPLLAVALGLAACSSNPAGNTTNSQIGLGSDDGGPGGSSGASSGGSSGPGSGVSSGGGSSGSGASSGGASGSGGSSGSSGSGSSSGSGTSSGGSVDGGKGTGHLPAQLPAHMLIGLEDNDGTWMGASGVKWDVRWAYFTASGGNGWYNGWAGGAANGSWASSWLSDVASQGFIPAIQYYMIQQDYAPTGDTGANLVASSGHTGKLQTPATMKDYFTKFKILLTAAKALNKPVVIILEGDTFGFVEMQTNNNPATYAAIADSGMPELAGLPNTVAGFGLAFLQLRKSVGATNVVMGPDVPAYAANGDFLNYTATDAIQPHVDYQYTSFFSKLGVGTNQTGAQYDFVASCPASADADQYAANGDNGRWWSVSDTASVNSESMNRYAEWLRLFNVASSTPWVLWQIPMGNSNSPNVPNQGGAWAGPYPSGYTLPAGCTQNSTSGCPGGYKDNRAEYFFGTGSALHMAKFGGSSRVFGLFFGAGTGGGSDQTADYYTDGKLYMKTHAGAFISSGGYPLTP